MVVPTCGQGQGFKSTYDIFVYQLFMKKDYHEQSYVDSILFLLFYINNLAWQLSGRVPARLVVYDIFVYSFFHEKK